MTRYFIHAEMTGPNKLRNILDIFDTDDADYALIHFRAVQREYGYRMWLGPSSDTVADAIAELPSTR